MSEYIPIPDVIKATQHYTVGGSDMQCVFYHQATPGTVTPALMSAVGASHVAWFNNRLRTYVSRYVSLTKIELIDCTTRDGPAVRYVAGLPIDGANGFSVVPPQFAPVLQWLSVVARRSTRGLTHIPGAPTNALTTIGDVSSTYRTNYRNAYRFLITGRSDPTVLVVVSRMVGNRARIAPLVTTIFDCIVRTATGTVRRRIIK